MNEKQNYTDREDTRYQTGDCSPRKSRGGLVAAALAVVILLGGVLNLMSVMNISLFHSIAETPSIRFSRGESQLSENDQLGAKTPMLGILAETVSPFLQNYYRLPKGVYVTEVLTGGAALTANIRKGDVITAFAGTPVETVTELASLVRSRKVGDVVRVSLSREGKQFTAVLTLGAEE